MKKQTAKAKGSNQYQDKLKNDMHWFPKTILITFTVISFTSCLWAINEMEFPGSPLLSPIPDGYVQNVYASGPVTASERRATTATVIDHYFTKMKSPLAGYGTVFYDTAITNGLPVYLLPAIAMGESSGAKNYDVSTYNFMGWGKGRIQFKSITDCIQTVGMKIATLSYYEDFMKNTDDIGEFCISYNLPEAKVYCKTIRNFMKNIQQVEWEI